MTPPLGSAKVLYAFVYDAPGTSRLLVITPTGRMKKFFRDLEAGGQSFGSGTPEDRETLRRKPVWSGIVPREAFVDVAGDPEIVSFGVSLAAKD